MIKKLLSLVMIVIVVIGMCSCASSKKQDTTENSKNKSIAVTSVAICEILDELEYDNVVAVPETSSEKLPERYKNLPTIGSSMSPDYEKIKSVSPDLVLSPKSLENSLSKDYTNAGINSAFLDLSSVQGMCDAITSLGELLDRNSQAEKLLKDYKNYMSDYKSSNDKAKSVLILMAFPDGFYLVATENSYVGNLVELAGGKNVYGIKTSGDENGFVSINPEDMVKKKPDMIMIFAHYNEKSAFKYMKNEFKTNKFWQYYDAVKNDNIVYLPSKYFGMSATLDWKDSLDYLKPILYGE